MAILGVDSKCYILALFIRSDGQRFLLGSGYYEFKDKQQHFAANTIANDVIEVQGNDGYMLGGQVRRPGVQSFDGYVGDGTTSKTEVEEYRRDFLSFFRKNFMYKVVYVFPDGSAIQRKRGFLVDAPTVQELYQIYPEYHVALNFEDINYYFYDEDADGDEIYGKSAVLGLTVGASGGLIWDNLGAVSIPYSWTDPLEFSGSEVTIVNSLDVRAPITDLQLKGDTYQQTYSGKNKSPDISQYSWSVYHATQLSVSSNSVSYKTNQGYTSTGVYIHRNSFPSICPELNQSGYIVSFTIKVNIASRVKCGYEGSTEGTFVRADIPAGETRLSFLTEVAASSISFYVTNQTGATVEISDFQVEQGSIATDYEPYVGGIPSPSPDYPQNIQTVTGEQTVSVHGKNLFSGDYAQFDNAGGTGSLYRYFALPDDSEYRLTLVAKNNIPTFSSQHAIGFTKNGGDAANGYAWVVFKESGAAPLNVGDVFARSSTAPQKFGFVSIYPGTSENLQWFVDNFEIQLEKNSSSTSYEPYQSQSYKINLGKNLLDMATLVDGYVTASGTFETAHPLGEMRSDFIKVVPDTTYTFSIIETTDTNQSWFGIGEYSSRDTGSFIRRDVNAVATATSITFTTSATTQYIVVSARNMAGATEAQLELGSATSYAPYFTPIELCKIGDYQDYIYKSGDDWYVHKETGGVTYTGGTSENWDLYSAGTSVFRIRILDMKGQDNQQQIAPLLCNYYIPIDYAKLINPAYYPDYGIAGRVTSSSGIAIRNKDCADVTAFKTWLSTYNTSVYYVLATPTDTQITNQALIEQLEALGAMKLFVGENNILVTATNPNLPAALEANYFTGIDFSGAGYEWEPGEAGGTKIITVDSIDNVYPLLTVNGPATNPTVTNITTGTIFRYNGTVTSSQVLKVDMMNKTATLNGTSVIGNVSGDWLYFQPGDNRVDYSTNNADAPNALIEWQEIVG